MTREQRKRLFSTVISFLGERSAIWVTGGFFWGLGLLLTAWLTPLGTRAVAIYNAPRQLEEIAATLKTLQDSVNRATGEDRVIRQTPGLSYVEEPVYQGENVILYMVAERTTLGRDCRLVDWTPLFTDELNITLPGQRGIAGPVRRQISDAPTKLRIEVIPPASLQPGRIELYLVLEYQCAGKTVPDRTDVVTYRLLEVKGGEGGDRNERRQ